jgi:hypothetical protein
MFARSHLAFSARAIQDSASSVIMLTIRKNNYGAWKNQIFWETNKMSGFEIPGIQPKHLDDIWLPFLLLLFLFLFRH